MTRDFRKVLVAIRDIERKPAALLQKAAAIASPGAHIELFHVLTGPVSVSISGIRQARDVVASALRATAERTSRRLQRLARSRALASRRVSVHVNWDYPIADAIVRRAREIGADLIVAGAQPHRFAGRLLLVNTDWELIRETPCPVLVVKPAGRYRRAPVIAAVDPFHANDKPARLDARLLDAARSVARALGSEAHVFHAYTPLAALMPASMMQPVPLVISAEEEAVYARHVRRTFEALANRAKIPPSRRHLRVGEVPMQLAEVVRETGAQIVVMGALSRSGLKRVFIGNTAERVLDRLRCDLLVVKPRSFRSRVARKVSYTPMRAIPAVPV